MNLTCAPPRLRRDQEGRAFALPVVIMVVMLVSLLLAVMLQRSAAQGYTVKRQMNAYMEHHASRGFQEILNFWISSLGRIPVNEVLEGDGHVFDLELTDGSTVKVFLRDAQGTLPTSLTGLSDAQQYLVVDPLKWLQSLYPNRMDLVRSVGPRQVSAMTAPTEVLDCLEAATLSNEPSGVFSAEIIKARSDGTIDRAEVLAAADTAGIKSGQPANDLMQRITVEPTLYRAIVELYTPSRRNRPAARYSGLMQLPASSGGNGGGNGGGNNSLISASLFLSWGPMPIE